MVKNNGDFGRTGYEAKATIDGHNQGGHAGDRHTTKANPGASCVDVTLALYIDHT